MRTFRKIVKYTLISIFFLLALNFVFCFLTNYDPEEALPPKPQALLSIKHPKKLVTEYQFLLDQYPELEKVKKALRLMPLVPNFRVVLAQVAKGPVFIFNTGYYRGIFDILYSFKDQFLDDQEGLHLVDIPQLKDQGIYMLNNGKTTLGFLAKKRNLILFSLTATSLQMAQMNLETDQPTVQFEQSGDISLFFDTELLLQSLMRSYPQLALLKDVFQNNQSGTAQVYFHSDFIKSTLSLRFKAPSSYQDKVFERLLNMKKGSPTLSQIAPLHSSSFFSFSVSEFQTLYQYLVVLFRDNKEMLSQLQIGQRAVKYISQYHLNDFFDWMGEEVAAITLSDYGTPLLLMQVKNKDKFEETMKAFIGSRVASLDQQKVYSIVLPGIFGFLKSIFAPSIQLPFYTLYQDKYLIISNSANEIVDFLKKSAHVALPVSKDYKLITENTDKSAQIQFYADLSYGYFPFVQISPIFQKMLQKYHKLGGSVRLAYPDIEIEMVIAK